MSAPLEYIALNKADPDELLMLLNKQKLRAHLIEHELFDAQGLASWIDGKMQVDSTDGCKVRAIICEGRVAGWCGIQAEDGAFELAVVLDEEFWGIGKAVFADLMGWAKAFGHREVYIHLHHTRPEYRFLKRMAIRSYKNEMLGSQFMTYQLAVD